MKSSSAACGQEVLEVVPMIMRSMRAEFRKHRGDISVPQFRVLVFLGRNRGASLSDVAEHLGLTLPSMSAMIDNLVVRKFVSRRTHSADRRRVALELTARGEAALQSAREAAQASFAKKLAVLPDTDRASIIYAMQTLRSIFAASDELRTQRMLFAR